MHDSGICFICAHLASGENEGDELKRNYDYSEIVRRGQFPEDSAALDPETALPSFSGVDNTSQVLWTSSAVCPFPVPSHCVVRPAAKQPSLHAVNLCNWRRCSHVTVVFVLRLDFV